MLRGAGRLARSASMRVGNMGGKYAGPGPIYTNTKTGSMASVSDIRRTGRRRMYGAGGAAGVGMFASGRSGRQRSSGTAGTMGHSTGGNIHSGGIY